jgi:hypothetical protein
MRRYLVPRVGTGTPRDPYRAKYFTPGPEQIVRALTRAHAPKGAAWMVVSSDVTAFDQAAVEPHPDVFAFPRDLDAPLADPTGLQRTLTAYGLAVSITARTTARQLLAALGVPR